MDKYSELKNRVEQLKKNRENVPIETLQTKYRKPYNDLLETIKNLATECFFKEALDGIRVLKKDRDVAEEVVKAINDGKFARHASRAIFEHYDVDSFRHFVDKARDAAMVAWMPYWRKFLCLYVPPECWDDPYPPPHIYNELTDEFLVDEENNLWGKKPEWKSDQATIITAGACSLLAAAIREKEEKEHGQTDEH